MLIKLLPAVPELYLRLALTYEAISQAGRPANMVVRFSHIPGFRASHHWFAIFLEELLPRLIDRLDSNNRIKKSKCFIWRLGARMPLFLSLSCSGSFFLQSQPQIHPTQLDRPPGLAALVGHAPNRRHEHFRAALSCFAPSFTTCATSVSRSRSFWTAPPLSAASPRISRSIYERSN